MCMSPEVGSGLFKTSQWESTSAKGVLNGKLVNGNVGACMTLTNSQLMSKLRDRFLGSLQ